MHSGSQIHISLLQSKCKDPQLSLKSPGSSELYQLIAVFLSSSLKNRYHSHALNLASRLIVNLIFWEQQPSVRKDWESAGFQSNQRLHQVIHFSFPVDGVPICEITCCSGWLEWKAAHAQPSAARSCPHSDETAHTNTQEIYFFFKKRFSPRLLGASREHS